MADDNYDGYINTATRRRILKGFWGHCERDSGAGLWRYDAYFTYYNRTRDLYLGHEQKRPLRDNSLDNIIRVVSSLRMPSATWESLSNTYIHEAKMLQSDLKGAMIVQELVTQEIYLTATLFLMTRFSNSANASSIGKHISWTTGTLKEVLENHFPRSTGQREAVRLPKDFTVRNLELKARIGIVWTDSLVDHLRLEGEDTSEPRVFIFHHARFLKLHLGLENAGTQVFPEGLVQETLQTLAILLQNVSKTENPRAWLMWFRVWFWIFRRSSVEQEGMVSLWNRERSNQLDCAVYHYDLEEEESQSPHFEYWHLRIVKLQKAFEDRVKEQEAKRRRHDWRWFVFLGLILAAAVWFGSVG